MIRSTVLIDEEGKVAQGLAEGEGRRPRGRGAGGGRRVVNAAVVLRQCRSKSTITGRWSLATRDSASRQRRAAARRSGPR